MADLKQRKTASQSLTTQDSNGSTKEPEPHPLGEPKHGLVMQAIRIFNFTVYFTVCCVFIHGAQLLGIPLYWIDKSWFDAWMAMTKQYFGLLLIAATQLFCPTIIRIGGDKSVAGLLKQDKNAMLSVDFGERVVYMCNHQLYTDWVYMWWFAYTNNPPMHGHIYIILKDSLKWIPFVGPGMQFYGFIFMARKWATDQLRLRESLRKLSIPRTKPIGGPDAGMLDPMCLLIFPEGTNLSANTRNQSRKYSEKSGILDMKHQVLPRSTGLQFCLQELSDTVEYLYDCTIGYEGVPPGRYGAELFTLRSVYFQGRPPKSVNMHWRRFRVKDIPIDDHEKTYQWVLDRWREKDELLETFMASGRFPSDPEAIYKEGASPSDSQSKYIETEVRLSFREELMQIFVPVLSAAMIGRILVKIADRVLGPGELFSFGKNSWF